MTLSAYHLTLPGAGVTERVPVHSPSRISGVATARKSSLCAAICSACRRSIRTRPSGDGNTRRRLLRRPHRPFAPPMSPMPARYMVVVQILPRWSASSPAGPASPTAAPIPNSRQTCVALPAPQEKCDDSRRSCSGLLIWPLIPRYGDSHTSNSAGAYVPRRHDPGRSHFPRGTDHSKPIGRPVVERFSPTLLQLTAAAFKFLSLFRNPSPRRRPETLWIMGSNF